jgi:hypothetical protein
MLTLPIKYFSGEHSKKNEMGGHVARMEGRGKLCSGSCWGNPRERDQLEYLGIDGRIPSRRCLHFEVVGGLEWSNETESYAGGSVATGRASQAGKVKGDDPG